MHPWKVLESAVLIDDRYLRVREERILLPNGNSIDRFHVIETADWVGVIARTEEGRIVLVDQYRHGIERVSRELPAGAVDEGEHPLEAAQRELLEETGYAATDWAPLMSFATEPNRHTSRAHFFVARNVRKVAEPSPDPTENLVTAIVTPEELLRAVAAGELVHAVHVAAILMAAHAGHLG